MPDAPPPEGDAAAGGATRSGLPSIRDLGRRDAAPRKPWNSAPPTDADIAGSRRKKRLDAEEGGGRRRSGVWRACCARGRIFVWCGRFARSRGRIPSGARRQVRGFIAKETRVPGPTVASKVNASVWTLSMDRRFVLSRSRPRVPPVS
jgi:hypothetical protein